MIQRKFITNLGFLLVLNFLIKPFWILGIDRTVQNVVGSENYGFYFAVFNFSLLFNIILDFGISSFNNRNIAQNHQLLQKHFSGIISLRILLVVAYGIILFFVAFLIGYDSKQFYFLVWVGINQSLLSFILYLRSNISGLLLFKTDSIISVLDRFLLILICSFLLWGNVAKGPFQIEWLMYAQAIAYLITLLIALIIVIKKSGFIKLKWNGAFLLMIIKKSAPYAILFFLMGIYNRVDSVMIERILPGTRGEFQAGVYAQAYRLFDAGNNIALLFGVILLPIFSRMIKKGESVERLTKLSFTIIFTFSMIVAMASFYFSKEIMNLLYYRHANESISVFNERILDAGHIFGILMFSFIAVCSGYIFGTLLTALGDLKFMIKIALLGVVINLAINIIFIPSIEAVGAAYASLVAQFITAFVMVLRVKNRFSFRVNYPYLLRLSMYVILVVSANLIAKAFKIDTYLSIGFVIIFSIISAYFLGLLNLRVFLAFMKAD